MLTGLRLTLFKIAIVCSLAIMLLAGCPRP